MAYSKSVSDGSNNDTNELKKNLRYSDIGSLPNQILLPIDGYQNRELVSLEIALKQVKELSNIDHQINTAKDNCRYPSDGLSQNESAAIHIYTMEWHPTNKCLYYLLNSKLRLENRNLLKPWLDYLKLILTGLYKLKSFKGIVWRGVQLDLSQEYPTGRTFVWWGFSSCTKSLDVLKSEEFIGTTGPRTVFSIQCENGKDIRRHSYIKKENEIILLPGRTFRVTGNIELAPDAHIIHLQEIIPEVPLLADPSGISESKSFSSQTTTSVSFPPDFDNRTSGADYHDTRNVRNFNVSDIIRKRRASRTLEIIGEQLDDQDMKLIGNELKSNQHWSILDLASSGITDNDVDYLCEGLNDNCALSALNVCDSRISDRATRSIAQALRKNCTIKELSIIKNNITDRGCQALSDMLKMNEVMERLLLSENGITDKGIRYILEALSTLNNSLKELDLSGNRLTDECVDNIIKMLKANGSLTKLNLQENDISKEGKNRIREAAQKIKTLIELQL